MIQQEKPSPGGQAGDDLRPMLASSTGFASLAKRIAAWTTNCLASALIVVAGLGFGRQVLFWWAEDNPPHTARLGADLFADPSATHDVEFGNQAWTMSRRSMQGDWKRSLAELRTETASRTGQAPLPVDPVGPAERALLERLHLETPVMEERGAWKLYMLETPFPMVVGVREVLSGTNTPPRDELAASPLRVVTWGLGIPAAEDEWTLYTFAATEPCHDRFSGLACPDLPPGATRTLAVRVAGGGAAVCFEGRGEVDVWKGFFEQWFRDHGWTVGPWRQNGSSWYGRGRSGRTEQCPTTVDVQFGPVSGGGQAGLLVVSADRSPRDAGEER